MIGNDSLPKELTKKSANTQVNMGLTTPKRSNKLAGSTQSMSNIRQKIYQELMEEGSEGTGGSTTALTPIPGSQSMSLIDEGRKPPRSLPKVRRGLMGSKLPHKNGRSGSDVSDSLNNYYGKSRAYTQFSPTTTSVLEDSLAKGKDGFLIKKKKSVYGTPTSLTWFSRTQDDSQQGSTVKVKEVYASSTQANALLASDKKKTQQKRRVAQLSEIIHSSEIPIMKSSARMGTETDDRETSGVTIKTEGAVPGVHSKTPKTPKGMTRAMKLKLPEEYQEIFQLKSKKEFILPTEIGELEGFLSSRGNTSARRGGSPKNSSRIKKTLKSKRSVTEDDFTLFSPTSARIREATKPGAQPQPATRQDVQLLEVWLSFMMHKHCYDVETANKNRRGAKQALANEVLIVHSCMVELIRQETIACKERGNLFAQLYQKINRLNRMHISSLEKEVDKMQRVVHEDTESRKRQDNVRMEEVIKELNRLQEENDRQADLLRNRDAEIEHLQSDLRDLEENHLHSRFSRSSSLKKRRTAGISSGKVSPYGDMSPKGKRRNGGGAPSESSWSESEEFGHLKFFANTACQTDIRALEKDKEMTTKVVEVMKYGVGRRMPNVKYTDNTKQVAEARLKAAARKSRKPQVEENESGENDDVPLKAKGREPFDFEQIKEGDGEDENDSSGSGSELDDTYDTIDPLDYSVLRNAMDDDRVLEEIRQRKQKEETELVNLKKQVEEVKTEVKELELIRYNFEHIPQSEQSFAFKNGWQGGFQMGMKKGLDTGYLKGKKDGYSQGVEEGYSTGVKVGYEEAAEDNVNVSRKTIDPEMSMKKDIDDGVGVATGAVGGAERTLSMATIDFADPETDTTMAAERSKPGVSMIAIDEGDSPAMTDAPVLEKSLFSGELSSPDRKRVSDRKTQIKSLGSILLKGPIDKNETSKLMSNLAPRLTAMKAFNIAFANEMIKQSHCLNRVQEDAFSTLIKTFEKPASTANKIIATMTSRYKPRKINALAKLGKKKVLKLVSNVFLDRIKEPTAENMPFYEFIYTHQMKNYGFKKVVDKKFEEAIASVMTYKNEKRVANCYRFLNLNHKYPRYDAKALNFFISRLNFLVNSSIGVGFTNNEESDSHYAPTIRAIESARLYFEPRVGPENFAVMKRSIEKISEVDQDRHNFGGKIDIDIYMNLIMKQFDEYRNTTIRLLEVIFNCLNFRPMKVYLTRADFFVLTRALSDPALILVDDDVVPDTEDRPRADQLFEDRSIKKDVENVLLKEKFVSIALDQPVFTEEYVTAFLAKERPTDLTNGMLQYQYLDQKADLIKRLEQAHNDLNDPESLNTWSRAEWGDILRQFEDNILTDDVFQAWMAYKVIVNEVNRLSKMASRKLERTNTITTVQESVSKLRGIPSIQDLDTSMGSPRDRLHFLEMFNDLIKELEKPQERAGITSFSDDSIKRLDQETIFQIRDLLAKKIESNEHKKLKLTLTDNLKFK